MAAHLRAVFAGDGEEVSEVIARHYLDALEAVPADPDTGQIRGRAITALIRAAERAERTGAPARAAASYAAAAELTVPGSGDQATTEPATVDQPGTVPLAGTLWERAAQAAIADAGYSLAGEYAGKARDHYLRHGQVRAAARTQVLAGEVLRRWGRLGDSREQLTAAVKVLQADPDIDTVRALEELAVVEVFAGSPDAGRLSTEALALAEALDVDAGMLDGLFLTRAIYLFNSGQRLQSIAYLRESVRLATATGDNTHIGRALLNLADVLTVTDPVAAVEAARTSAGHLRRTGARNYLAAAIMNVAHALMALGDWDAAEAELAQAADSDGLADVDYIACYRAWLAALRGDAAAAETVLAGLHDLHASDDPQDKAMISVSNAFTAAARCQPRDALRHARLALTHVKSLGISHEYMRWAWPLAVRSAHELGAVTAVRDLLALLDSYRPGHLAPMLRAEHDLARARLTAIDGDQNAAAAFIAAISRLREQSTPYHLANGLLDYAQHLTGLHDRQAAEAALGEARDIAGRLRCQPLLDRAADLTPAPPAPAHRI